VESKTASQKLKCKKFEKFKPINNIPTKNSEDASKRIIGLTSIPPR